MAHFLTGGKHYRVTFTIYSTPGYDPINITIGLPEREALILMATPVKSVSIAVAREHGMIVDKTPEPLDFNPGGNKA